MEDETDRYVPTPVRETTCGLAPSSSVIVRAPGRLPAAVGLKKMLTEQLDPGGKLGPQSLVSEKSCVGITERILREVVPRLLNVTTLAVVLTPTGRIPKSISVGVNPTKVPIPVRGTSCGEVGSPSVIVTDPLRDPVPLGENVTLIEQYLPGWIFPAHECVTL